VDAIAVEAAALASADGGTVAPRCVRVAVDVSLRAAVVEVLLTVPVCGHVGSVDGNLATHIGVLLAE
jgi:hypothetical protein